MASLMELILNSGPVFSLGRHKPVGATARMLNPIISTLPVELLALIFTELVVPWHSAFAIDIPEPFDTRLRSVCRRWRDVVDSTPALWTRIDLKTRISDLDRLRVVLGRSWNAALELTINIGAMDDRLLPCLTPEVTRARLLIFQSDIKLETLHPHLEGLMLQLMKQPAPLLEGLKINHVRNIPDDIFSNMTPWRLSHVSLGNCYSVHPSWCIFKSTNLTDLVFHGEQIRTSFDDILVLLENLPKLQSLVWTIVPFGWQPFEPPETVFEPGSIHLLQLERLFVRLPAELAALLLFYLTFPASAQLTVDWDFYITEDIHSQNVQVPLGIHRRLFRHYLPKIFPDETSGYSSITVRPATLKEHEDGFSLILEHPVNSSIGPLSSFSYNFRWRARYSEEYLELITEIITSAGRNVTNFYVQEAPFMCDPMPWCRVLCLLPALKNIDVFGPGRATHSLFHALYLIASLSPNPLPALNTIRVGFAKANTFTLMIDDALDARVRAGFQKLELEVYESEVRLTMPMRLRLHRGIKRVVCDGKTRSAIDTLDVWIVSTTFALFVCLVGFPILLFRTNLSPFILLLFFTILLFSPSIIVLKFC